MDWNALVGALIGAGIPAVLVYVGLRRQRQSSDAETFGPAVLLLDRVNPDRLLINLNPDAAAQNALMTELRQQTEQARGRLLVVAAGHPRRRVRRLAREAAVKVWNGFHGSSWAVRDLQANKDNPQWMELARARHSEAVAAVDALIEENFAWTLFGRPLRASIARAVGKAGRRLRMSLASAVFKVRRRLQRSQDDDSTKAIDKPDGQP